MLRLILLCAFVSISALQSLQHINDDDWGAAYNLCTQDKQANACLLLI